MVTNRMLWAFLTLALAGVAAGSSTSPFAPAPSSPVRVGSQPNDIAAAEVNNDGHLDLITANAGSNDMSVLLGDGQGGFRQAPGSPFPAGATPHLLAVGDVDRDGKSDIALTSHDSNDVVVLLGNGKGGFAPAPSSPLAALRATPPHNHGLALADVNGDDALDIITGNQ